MHRFLIAGLVLVLLSGCAAMSESDCRHADWYQLGDRDARQGRAADYFADRAEACREYGMGVDRNAYDAGWHRGLESFCTADGGFRHGLDGSEYRETCPPRLERGFLAGYRLGHDIHEADAALDRLDSEIASLEDDLEDLEDREGKEAERLRRRIRELRDDARNLERELGRLEATAAERGFPVPRY